MTAALAASARSRRAPLRSVPRETTMQLITDEQRERLLANGRRTAAGENIDPPPVVKLFTPDANATWLLTELDPAEPDLAFGLCDLGLGFPELGYVSLAELRRLRGTLGLPRSEEHTSELQSLMRISYSVFCLKKITTLVPTMQR